MKRRGEALGFEGQSLVELIIGISIAAVVAGSIVGALLLSVRTNKQSITYKEASSLGQEVLDNAKSLSEGDWNALYSQSIKSATSTYHLNATSTISAATGTETIVVGGITYTRWVSIENVNRSVTSGAITSNGSDPEDPSTQKVTAHVEWPFFGDTADISITQYLTRWSRNTVTVFTDWSGSSNVGGPITRVDSNYESSTGIVTSTVGQISLSSAGSASGTVISSTFDTGATGGVKINSILWQGSLGVGGTNSVKFQIASSNCSNGATNAPTCSSNIGWGGSKTSGDGAFIGSDGSSLTFYTPSGLGSSYAIPVNYHNNKRYFRYKIQLDKDVSSTSPVVNDAIISWSP